MTGLVIVTDRDSRPGRLAYFRAQAARVAVALGAPPPVGLHTGAQMVEASLQHPRNSIDHLVVCCHGGADWLLDSRHGLANTLSGRSLHQRSVAEFAEAWAPVLVDNALVSLCACNCSRSPTWWMRSYLGKVFSSWGVRSYVRGGEASFSARLRDGLVWWGLYPRVRGHRSAGDLLGNPLLSEHRWPAADRSTSLYQAATGNETATSLQRRKWVRLVKGELAERWLLGDDSAADDIGQRWVA